MSAQFTCQEVADAINQFFSSWNVKAVNSSESKVSIAASCPLPMLIGNQLLVSCSENRCAISYSNSSGQVLYSNMPIEDQPPIAAIQVFAVWLEATALDMLRSIGKEPQPATLPAQIKDEKPLQKQIEKLLIALCQDSGGHWQIQVGENGEEADLDDCANYTEARLLFDSLTTLEQIAQECNFTPESTQDFLWDYRNDP